MTTWLSCLFPADTKVQEALARVFLLAKEADRVKTVNWIPQNTDSRAKPGSKHYKVVKTKPKPSSNITYSLVDGNTKRDQALRMARVGKRGTAEIAQALGLNARTIRGWLFDSKQYESRKT